MTIAASYAAGVAESTSDEPRPPPVELGHLEPGGIAPSLFAMAERGAALRPETARALRGTVEIRFTQEFAAVRLVFSGTLVVIEDVQRGGRSLAADLVIRGSLPDIVGLVSVPLIGGVPRPTGARGRAALANVASGRVKVEGSRALARRLLQLLQI